MRIAVLDNFADFILDPLTSILNDEKTHSLFIK